MVCDDTEFIVEDTNVVKRWRAIKHEIEKHKWYLSERVGYDVGWDKAYVDWWVNHSNEFDKAHPIPKP